MATKDATRNPPDPQLGTRQSRWEKATAACLLPMAATTHAFAMAGLIQLARDLSDMIDGEAHKGETIDSGAAHGWALRLDTIMNAASDSQDSFAEVLHCAGHTAPLMSGSIVMRGAA